MNTLASEPRTSPRRRFLNDVRNYLKGCAYGFMALIVGFVAAFLFMINLVWHRPGETTVGYDPARLALHYSTVPEVWLAALLLFGVGFYLGLRGKLAP